MPSTLRNMVLVLLSITLIGSLAVGGSFLLTKDSIEQAKINKINTSIGEVLPTFDNNPYQEAFSVEIDQRKVDVYPATKSGEKVGYAIKTFTMKGFSGEIILMVGVLPNGTINKISVVEQNETPGLGNKILPEKSDFSKKFEGLDPQKTKLAVKKDKGDIDAITAATISSRAYIDAVERAVRVFNQIEKKSNESVE